VFTYNNKTCNKLYHVIYQVDQQLASGEYFLLEKQRKSKTIQDKKVSLRNKSELKDFVSMLVWSSFFYYFLERHSFIALF